MSKPKSVGELMNAHNVYFWRQEAKTVHLEDKKLRQDFLDQLYELLVSEAETYPEKGIGSVKPVRAIPLEAIDRLFNQSNGGNTG